MCHAYNIQFLVVEITGVFGQPNHVNQPNPSNTNHPFEVQYRTVNEPAPSDRNFFKKFGKGFKKLFGGSYGRR